MKPIASEELSGYLDGELDPQRMQDVERALASDSMLREEFDRLSGLDAQLRAAGLAARFEPPFSMPQREALSWRSLAAWGAVVAILAMLRLSLKVFSLPMTDGLIVNGVVAVLLLAGTAWMIRHDTDTYRVDG